MPLVTGELDYVTRPAGTYLRLTSDVKRNGAKLFVQIPLHQSAPASVKEQTIVLLHKKLEQLIHGRGG